MNDTDEQLNEKNYSNKELILRMLKLAWVYRRGCIIVIFMQVLLLAFTMSGLGFTGLGVDYIKYCWSVNNGIEEAMPRFPFGLNPPQEWSNLAVLGIIAGCVLLFSLMRSLLTFTFTIARAKLVQTKIVVDLRTRVYDKMQRLSFRFFDANASGSLINRVTGDVQMLRMFIENVVIEVFVLAISLAFYLFYMLRIHPLLTLACLGTTPIMWFLTGYYSKSVKPAFRRNRRLVDKLITQMSENIQGVHVIKGFALQQEEVEKFTKAADQVRDQQGSIFWKQSLFMPAIHAIVQMNMVILMAYGGWLVIHGQLAVGTGLFVFYRLLEQFSQRIGNIANIAGSIQRSLVGAQRVFEILDTPVEIEVKNDPVIKEKVNGKVEFRNVTFNYNGGESVLSDISFRANPGQCIAILGATGSGKSTLLSLISRFYDPTNGRIMIDDADLRDMDIDQLRKHIGVVFQESFLFSNSAAANIAFGFPDASREEIEKAAKIASAHGFIMELPNGYDSILSEGGGDLSGGQRQRLAIARAIIHEPPILLMDDPTAAIDPQTENEILEAMDNAMKGRTTFVVAHRLSTLRRADHVIVLEKGKIVQTGTHDELIKADGHYKTAAETQLADNTTKELLGMELEEVTA